MEATLTKGSESIQLPLLDESSSPLVSTDVGKPSQNFQENGGIDPRMSDQRSQTRSYTLTIRLTESDAYQKAIQLADMVKSSTGGDNFRLDLPFPEFKSNMLVAPAAQSPLNITMNSGRNDWIDISLSLTRVNAIQGSTTHEFETPTATGNGPVTLSQGSDSVEFVEGLSIERDITRPNSEFNPTTQQFPNYLDYAKSAVDSIELEVQLTEDAAAKAQTLCDTVGTPLGRNPLTLDFNGLFGLGSFSVSPNGSGALRLQRQSAQKGWVHIPSLELRVVQ